MKNIIITGASKGIGKALTTLFLTKGHTVLAIARDNNKLSELKNLFPDDKLICLAGDLTENTFFETIKETIKDWKTVDVLYNNAGVLINKPFVALTEEDFLASWQLNFLAAVKMIQLILPKCTKESHVVNISTMGAVQGSVKFAGLTAYGTAKAALCNLTELVAEEHKETGPKCNCIALGAVQTEMLEAAFPGYKAPINPQEMALYLYDFGLNGYKYYNGKILQTSSTTP